MAWAALHVKFRAVEVPTHGDQLELGLLLVKPFTGTAWQGGRLAPSYCRWVGRANEEGSGQARFPPSPCRPCPACVLPPLPAARRFLFWFSSSKAEADCRGVAISLVLLIPLLSSSIRRFSIISLPLGPGRRSPSLK